MSFTWDYFNDHGPNSDDYRSEKDREKYKKWFANHESYFNSTKLMDFWMQDNTTCVNEFKQNFLQSHNKIAKRTASFEIREN